MGWSWAEKPVDAVTVVVPDVGGVCVTDPAVTLKSTGWLAFATVSEVQRLSVNSVTAKVTAPPEVPAVTVTLA